MGIFDIIRCILPRERQMLGGRKGHSLALDAAPFSPRRLESRRLLDASAAGLLLAPLGDSGEFVQVGENADTSSGTPVSNAATGDDQTGTPPSNLQFAPVAMINENGFAQLQLTFDDPGQLDTHTVEIDWGDGTSTTVELTAGERFVGTPHQYLDDDPSITSQDEYTITVKVTDDDGGVVTGETTVLVKNVAPSNLQFAPVAMIDENGFAQLQLTFDDPGQLDTHTVEIDWGDGTSTTVELTAGERFVGTNHQYLDDDPSVTSQDEYTITVKVTDDDGGVTTGETTVLVKNVAPSNLQFAPVAMINENGFAQLQLTFDDPGQLDTHTVEIDWGDGTSTTVELTAGERFVGTNHQYLDDDPSITSQDEYTITVTVTDDDGGVVTGETTVLVKNVAPSNLQFAPVAMINENGFAQLQLTFDDPGQLDTHTVEIDWGDGTSTTVELTAGERFVGTPHQYLDDDPSITSQDEYTITVTVTDDDGGVVTGETTVLVKNVAPVIETLTVTPSSISEGNFVTVTGTYSDVGTLDTHTATIRWGDGTVEEVELQGSDGSGSFTISHFYADNDTVNPDDGPIPDNLYTIAVTIVDDDGGVATKPIDVTVLNVSPDLEPIIAVTGVNSKGEVTLTIRFTDPGADTLTVFVDWGDVRDPNDPSIPALEPFVIDLTDLGAPGTFTVTLEHTYDGPPNPLSPASAIEIFVFVGDDNLGETFVQDDGMSQIRTVALTNPGVGPEPVPDVSTAQGRLLFARQVTSTFYFEASSNVEEALRGAGFGAGGGDPNVISDRFLELRVFDASGQVVERHRLKTEVLKDLPALFRILPDRHYALYMVRVETKTSQLVLDFYVRNGKVVDPGDDTEGTRDRPPTEEATNRPEDVSKLVPKSEEVEQKEDESDDVKLEDAELDESGEDASGARALPDNRRSRLDWGPALAGLVATGSFSSWAKRVDRTLAQAGPRQWNRLRLRNPHQRKNR